MPKNNTAGIVNGLRPSKFHLPYIIRPFARQVKALDSLRLRNSPVDGGALPPQIL